MTEQIGDSLQTPPASAGTSDYTISWDAFVQLIREITVAGYQSMRSKARPQREWEEDTFTINLRDYIRPLVRHHPLAIQVQTQVHVYTEKMKSGEESSKKAVKIDLHLSDLDADYERIYFAWEAKRVTDRRLDKEQEHLISKYISEGIFRFIDEEYARDVSNAGMLGYILTGKPSDIVAAINASMQYPQRCRPLQSVDHLQPADPIATFTETFTDVYQSQHTREPSKTSIHLTHLFLTFDFCEAA